MSILSEGYKIDNKYEIKSLIKANGFVETYRIADNSGNLFFLKLFDIQNTPDSLKTESGKVYEIVRSAMLRHKNLIEYISDGEFSFNGSQYQYLITEYFKGFLLAEFRDTTLPYQCAEEIAKQVLQGLQYLDKSGLSHNDICPRNIMIDISPEGELLETKIIDMGHLSFEVCGNPFFTTCDLDPECRAPETYLGIYNRQSDLFSVGVVLYYILYGHKPWNADIADYRDNPSVLKQRIKAARKKDVDYTNSQEVVPAYLVDIIKKALSLKSKDRFKDASEFIKAIENHSIDNDQPIAKASEIQSNDLPNQATETSTASADPAKDFGISKAKGNGFKDIAGMQDLKDLLSKKVIFVLKNKERAEKYKLTPPNGMLLYGPPGCGKTFFAEKFAEEAGFNFSFIKASDLASIYIHGSQGMIADLFKQAEKKVPVMLCFDEFDAMVPKRQSNDNSNVSGEVNEFLSQLNNCAKRGIFVIGTSNRPDRIDPAVLRKGRIDTLVYVPLPDKCARKAMFELYLKDRPCEQLDFDAIADATEKYVSSDIAYISNDAAMVAAFTDVKISQQIIMDSIKSTRPSLSTETIQEYEDLRKKIEDISEKETHRRVGFATE